MLKLLKNFTKKDWLLSILVVLLVVFQVWLDLKLPDYMSQITRLVQTEGKPNVRDTSKWWIYDFMCDW